MSGGPEVDDPRTPIVVVVDAETPGNVGTIARAMKNFGLSDLRLVDPPELDPDGEAYGFAGHAREDVLPDATETTLDEVVADFFTVGCTAITGEDARRHVRYPRRPRRRTAGGSCPAGARVRSRGHRAVERGA